MACLPLGTPHCYYTSPATSRVATPMSSPTSASQVTKPQALPTSVTPTIQVICTKISGDPCSHRVTSPVVFAVFGKTTDPVYITFPIELETFPVAFLHKNSKEILEISKPHCYLQLTDEKNKAWGGQVTSSK